MRSLAESLLDRLAAWPDEDLLELDELAREIEARRSDIYAISDAEWRDLQEGILQADRKEFVAESVVTEANNRHRR
jgi:hypothetical protein